VGKKIGLGVQVKLLCNAPTRDPTWIHDIVTCYCQYGCCAFKQATSVSYYFISKNTIPQSQYSTTILDCALAPTTSHLPSIDICTCTTTIPLLHHQFANKPCGNQGFFTHNPLPIVHLWECPPDGTLLSWNNLWQGPQACGEGEDEIGCTGKTFMPYMASTRYPTCIHNVVHYCGWLPFTQMNKFCPLLIHQQ
jgi:hypothetical protein